MRHASALLGQAPFHPGVHLDEVAGVIAADAELVEDGFGVTLAERGPPPVALGHEVSQDSHGRRVLRVLGVC